MSEEIDKRPKSPLEAAIDAATGYKPGDENRVVSDAEQDGQGESGGAEAAEVRTADETKPGEMKENPAPVKEKRDWVNEAYECFIENAVDMEPTDPVKAIAAYFEKNAADNLKMKVEHEGKTAEGCWKFIEAVAKKALGSRSGHIDPVAVYAIAMHYFQDVPKDWDKVEKPSGARLSGVKKPKGGKFKGEPPKKTDLKGGKHKTLEKAKEEKVKPKPKAKKRGGEQGFFFDLMETEMVGPDAGNGGVAAAAQDGKEAGDAE